MPANANTMRKETPLRAHKTLTSDWTRDAGNIDSSRRMRPKSQIPAEIEEYRDEHWRREGTRQVETALDAECFIEQVGFAACLTDSRPSGPWLSVPGCGRRDPVMPG